MVRMAMLGLFVFAVAACAVTVPGYQVDNGGGPGGGTQSACAEDGLYCGQDGVSGNPATLYRCHGGMLYEVQVCDGECQVIPGMNDQCSAACMVDGALCASNAECCTGTCGGPGVCGAIYANCDPVVQDGCPGLACFTEDSTSPPSTYCGPSGNGGQGAACNMDADCALGFECSSVNATANECAQLCDGATVLCQDGADCNMIPGFANYGVCP